MKISPEVREAIKEAHFERTQGDEWDCNIFDDAEKILNRPKFPPVLEKVMNVFEFPDDYHTHLKSFPRDIMLNHIDEFKKNLAKALEGLCYVPEKVTTRMLRDVDCSTPGKAIKNLFQGLREGRYNG